ncbi:MAG: hypothetical protein GEU80_09190 [Dehalococcoidia bacterium]|nr:hypothetical protein [Dehalococcoidia bacterium]
MVDILDDARFQFDSAEEQLDTVDELISEFLKNDPYSYVVERNRVTGEYLFRAIIRAHPDRRLVKVIGDTLRDLRVGLDYAAHALSEIGHPAPAGTEFPIFWDGGRFKELDGKGEPKRGSGLYKIRGMDAPVQAAIQGLQPFMESPGDPKAHPLWMLHDLDIAAKHKKPLVTGAVAHVGMGLANGYISSMSISNATAAIKPGAFHDRAIVGRILAAPDTNVSVNLIPTYDVAFDQAGPGRGEMARGALRRLVQHVKVNVLTELEKLI